MYIEIYSVLDEVKNSYDFQFVFLMFETREFY